MSEEEMLPREEVSQVDASPVLPHDGLDVVLTLLLEMCPLAQRFRPLPLPPPPRPLLRAHHRWQHPGTAGDQHDSIYFKVTLNSQGRNLP